MSAKSILTNFQIFFWYLEYTLFFVEKSRVHPSFGYEYAFKVRLKVSIHVGAGVLLPLLEKYPNSS